MEKFLKFQLTSEKRGCYNIYELAIVLFPLLHTLQTLDGAIAKKKEQQIGEQRFVSSTVNMEDVLSV